MNEDGPYSSQPYYREFGGWNDALAAAGLRTNHRNGVPEAELVAELQRLDELLERVPRFEDMEERGAFSGHTYMRRWGSWPEAKVAAGLRRETRTSRRIEREELVDALVELAQELGKAPTQSEMNELGEFSQRPFYRKWDSWDEALDAAGLTADRSYGTSDERLLEALRSLADDLGYTPTVMELNEQGSFSVWPYLHAFGSYNDAVRAAGLSVNKEYDALMDALQYGKGWSVQREKALERDDWSCQHPGCSVTEEDHQTTFGWGLEVHHVTKFRTFDDPETANELSNLITLCRPHHAKWERQGSPD